MSTVDEIAHSERTAIRRRLIAAINGQPPIKLASYAPLVSSAENRGDQTAIRITQRAARLLIENLRTLRTNPKNPLVLIGSVLGASSPVGREVRRELADLTPLDSPGAELGAAWLAAMRASGGEVPHPVSG
jgi:N-acetylglucosamine kinase-like BadF-type ATPase